MLCSRKKTLTVILEYTQTFYEGLRNLLLAFAWCTHNETRDHGSYPSRRQSNIKAVHACVRLHQTFPNRGFSGWAALFNIEFL
jgi:hypothetical protein